MSDYTIYLGNKERIIIRACYCEQDLITFYIRVMQTRRDDGQWYSDSKSCIGCIFGSPQPITARLLKKLTYTFKTI